LKFNKVIYSNVLISLAVALHWFLLAFEIPEVVCYTSRIHEIYREAPTSASDHTEKVCTLFLRST